MIATTQRSDKTDKNLEFLRKDLKVCDDSYLMYEMVRHKKVLFQVN